MQRVCARLLATRGLSQSTPFEAYFSSSPIIPLTYPSYSRHYSTSPTTDHLQAAVVSNTDTITTNSLFFSEHAASLIDHLHTTTGLPWWATLATVAAFTRAALFPLSLKATKASLTLSSLIQTARDRANQEVNASFIQQAMKQHQHDPDKLKDILELKNLPQKPSVQHIAHHLTSLIKHKKKSTSTTTTAAPTAVSPAWILAAPLIQLPIFITTMATVRHMSLTNWPGFSTGGMLWFPDLVLPAIRLSHISTAAASSSSSSSEVAGSIVSNMTPMGIAGIILPACIILSTFTTIETNFNTTNSATSGASPNSRSNTTIMTDVLRSVFEVALIPISFITLFLPQGTLCYWATSSSLALLQSRIMKSTSFKAALGVVPPPMDTSLTAKQIEVLNTAAQLTAKGKHKQGIEVLQPLLKLSNNHPRVMFALGTMHSALGEWQQAASCFVKSAECHDDVYLQARAWLAAVPGLLSSSSSTGSGDASLQQAEKALEIAKRVLKGDADRKMTGELEEVLALKKKKKKN